MTRSPTVKRNARRQSHFNSHCPPTRPPLNSRTSILGPGRPAPSWRRPASIMKSEARSHTSAASCPPQFWLLSPGKRERGTEAFNSIFGRIVVCIQDVVVNAIVNRRNLVPARTVQDHYVPTAADGRPIGDHFP